MRFGIVVFPGSNCDADCRRVLQDVIGVETAYLWHREERIEGIDAVVLAGGFSYGDYLRPGAIARLSPIMGAVRRFALDGGLVIGICNGFQILCEAGLLPGALLPNAGMHFRCETLPLRVEQTQTPFTNAYRPSQVAPMPIAHREGRYHAEPDVLEALESGGRVVFRYCDATGAVDESENPNGSMGNIAGIINERGNVLGMMPHPERCAEMGWTSGCGRGVFDSMVRSLSARAGREVIRS